MADGPAAVLFDCDGTLADTEPLSARAWRDVLSRRGVEVHDTDHGAIIGRAWPYGFDHFSARADLGDPDLFRTELRSHARALYAAELRLFPDTVATLRQLADAGVPVAVVSSSTGDHVRRCLDREGLRSLVEVVVGADAVTRHKPHPEPYLTAASALSVPIAACTAVEDTGIGVASARSAGAFTVAVVRGVVGRDTLGDADRIVDTLSIAAVRPPPDRRASTADPAPGPDRGSTVA